MHDDAFGMFLKKTEEGLLGLFSSHGVEIHKKKSGVEVALQTESFRLFVFVDVLHGCGNAVVERHVPQRGEACSADHVAVHVDAARGLNERRNEQPVVGGQTDVVLFRDVQSHAGKKIGRNGEELDLCSSGFRHFSDAATIDLGDSPVQHMKE